MNGVTCGPLDHHLPAQSPRTTAALSCSSLGLAPGKGTSDTQPRHHNDFAVLKATLGSVSPGVCQASHLALAAALAPGAGVGVCVCVCVCTGTAASSLPGSLTSSASLFVKEKFQWVHPTHGTQVQKLYLSTPLPRRSHAP